LVVDIEAIRIHPIVVERKLANTGMLDVEALLTEITPEQPCGENLEYDSAFLLLDEAIQGKPEVQYGDTITPATPPDWKIVAALSSELLARSRDLRVAVAAARAGLNLRGMPGFSSGLSLIEGLLKLWWESVHPQLDPSDDNDPMSRVNALSALTEFNSMLREVRETPLVVSRAHGRFSLRDIDIATGELQVPEEEVKPALAIIDAAFLESDLDELNDTFHALEQSCASAIQIEVTLTERVGASQALDLAPLSKLLKRARDFVGARLERRTGIANAGELDTGDGNATHDAQGLSASRKASGEITSPEDVVRMLGKICDYYAQHEPSSPIPLLLQRAQRLVGKSFVEILQDLAPDGLNQVYQVGGIQNE
jgi:type VI secretion system protein ImpA